MTKKELLANLPPLPTADLLPSIHGALESSELTIVVLDDDPTGTQTVFDVPVLTDLSPEAIRDAIDQAPPLLFLLTNSRTLTESQTTELHQNLGKILKEYSDEIIIISRSDSTLRGHFPLETNTLKNTLGIPEAPTLFIPFSEGDGHLTLNDTHYVVQGETATPAHLTPFAKDDTFPFSHSHLPDYIIEKSGIPTNVQSISIEDLRTGNITKKLEQIPPFSTCIINATTLADLNILSLALHKIDRRFIIHSGASFVQSLAGITTRPPLDPWQMQDLAPNPNGGLIILGSHVPKTTNQLNHLLKNAPKLSPIELSTQDILNSTFNPHTSASEVQAALTSGQSVALFTSHKRIDASTATAEIKSENLAISQALVAVVKNIKIRPSFIIAKGNTTSSDIATDALGVKKAQVLGQILPGVPVWTIGNETPHPGLAYIPFPGNVGDNTALTQAVTKLTS